MFQSLLLSATMQVTQQITIHSLVPPHAGLGWKLEFLEISEPISAHYHKIQKQIMIIAEGRLQVNAGNQTVIGSAGTILCVEPGTVHELVPLGTVRFFALDIPGFVFPEDVYEDTPTEVHSWVAPTPALVSLETCFGAKFDRGSFQVFDIIDGTETEQRWSVALLEINDSPKHFHVIEKEIFVVVAGKLAIEIDGVTRFFSIGQWVEIRQGMIHQLRSAQEHPVRVLCFSFPAFDPTDMHFVE